MILEPFLSDPLSVNFGDKVSVFVDIYRTITQGEAVVSGGERLFVGNGIAQLVCSLFKFVGCMS